MMKRNSTTNNVLISSRPRRSVKRATRASYSIDSLGKELQDLHAAAARGEYQAQIRLETISQLLDPCLNFCESDVHRIINKGYPPQVERGLKLYRLMSRLLILCEPVGDVVGAACRVRLINFEDLTWSKFIDIKGHTHALILRMSDNGMTSERFDGLELLRSEEKDLYERAKPYFGGRKRPTLKTLALDLLAEEGEDFTDRSVSNHLAAAREFRDKHKDKLAFRWAFVGGVDSYNRNPKSARESYYENIAGIRKVIGEFVIPSYSMGLGQVFAGMNEDIQRSARIFQEAAVGVSKLMQQGELMSKSIASAAYGIMRMPQFPLPESIFRGQLYVGKK